MGNQQAGGAGGATNPASPTAGGAGPSGAGGSARANAQAAASAAQLPKGVKRMPPELQRKFAAGQTHNRMWLIRRCWPRHWIVSWCCFQINRIVDDSLFVFLPIIECGNAVKILIRGDRGVGKTALFRRLEGGPFVEEHIPTPEVQVTHVDRKSVV